MNVEVRNAVNPEKTACAYQAKTVSDLYDSKLLVSFQDVNNILGDGKKYFVKQTQVMLALYTTQLEDITTNAKKAIVKRKGLKMRIFTRAYFLKRPIIDGEIW